jgi:hypothetical protein
VTCDSYEGKSVVAASVSHDGILDAHISRSKPTSFPIGNIAPPFNI